MKTYTLTQTSIEEPLQLLDVQIPVPKGHEVLIKTHSFSINPVDVKTRKGGGIFGMVQAESPLVLGWDVSGEVMAIGEAVDNLKVGDAVFGMVNFPGHGQAYAEYTLAPESHLAIKPGNLTHEQAAASTLAALTAYQVLARNVKAGDTLLIHAAAGGVGHFAVQIAKLMGAHVIGTASARNESYLKSLGVDTFIDYTQTDFTTVVKDVDFVLDTMGDEVLIRSMEVVKPGGAITTIPTGVPPALVEVGKQRQVHVEFQLVESNGEDMAQLATWLQTGELKPHVSHIFGFEEIEKAHQQMMTGKTKGKIIVNI